MQNGEEVMVDRQMKTQKNRGNLLYPIPGMVFFGSNLLIMNNARFDLLVVERKGEEMPLGSERNVTLPLNSSRVSQSKVHRPHH